MPAPGAILHPVVMHLAAIGTGFTQNDPALRTYQPAGLDLFRAIRALSRQRHLWRNCLVELHTDKVENDRETDNKK